MMPPQMGPRQLPRAHAPCLRKVNCQSSVQTLLCGIGAHLHALTQFRTTWVGIEEAQCR